MNTNEFVEEKKHNVFYKIINFIKNIFKSDKALPAPDILNEEIPDINSVFDDTNIQIDTQPESTEISEIEHVQEDPKLLDLQSKFESNEIALSDLSDEDLNNLNSLYLRQIEELNKQLNITTF